MTAEPRLWVSVLLHGGWATGQRVSPIWGYDSLSARCPPVELAKMVSLMYLCIPSKGIRKWVSRTSASCTYVLVENLNSERKGNVRRIGRERAPSLARGHENNLENSFLLENKIMTNDSLSFLFDISSICIVKPIHSSPQTYGESLLGSLGNKLASLTLGRPSQSMTMRSRPIPPPA